MKENINISEFEKIMVGIKKHLNDKYEIHHITLQLEFSVDDNKELIKK